MQNCHAVVWIDHKNARILKFNRTEDKELTIAGDQGSKHVHHKAGSIGSGHIYEDDNYLRAVAEGLRDAEHILVTGPSQVKWQLKGFLTLREPGLAKRIAGVEILNHVTDPELLAMARAFFKRHDRMLPH